MKVSRLKSAEGKVLKHVLESNDSDRLLLVFEDSTLCQIGADQGWDSDIEIGDVTTLEPSYYDADQLARVTAGIEAVVDPQPWAPAMWQGMFWMLLNAVADSPFCRCGYAPYTRGRPCPTCIAITLRETIKSDKKSQES